MSYWPLIPWALWAVIFWLDVLQRLRIMREGL